MKSFERNACVGRGSRAGFTLVEVLLVLMIMSGILVTMAEVLTAARTSRDTIHNVRETQLAGPAILDLIEHDLRGIYVFNIEPKLTLRIVDRVEAGLDADRSDFVTTTNGLVLEPSSSRFLRADVNEVGYCLRTNPDNNDFLELYRREDFGVDDEPQLGGNYTFLHDRVVGFDIRIYEEDGVDVDEHASWGSDHDEFSGIPARIEIDLSLELAPRLLHEQLALAPIHARTVTHRRVIRFPEGLRSAQLVQPVLAIPNVKAPVVATGAGGTPEDVEDDEEEGGNGDPGPFDFENDDEEGGGGLFGDIGGG